MLYFSLYECDIYLLLPLFSTRVHVRWQIASLMSVFHHIIASHLMKTDRTSSRTQQQTERWKLKCAIVSAASCKNSYRPKRIAKPFIACNMSNFSDFLFTLISLLGSWKQRIKKEKNITNFWAASERHPMTYQKGESKLLKIKTLKRS